MMNSYGHLYSIGYWANTKRWTKTHIRDCQTDKPVCGSQVIEGKSFQWCCWGYSEYGYIECDHCKKWRQKELLKENERLLKEN